MFIKNGKHYAFIRNGKMYALVRKIRQYWKTTQSGTSKTYYCYYYDPYGDGSSGVFYFFEKIPNSTGEYYIYPHVGKDSMPTSTSECLWPDASSSDPLNNPIYGQRFLVNVTQIDETTVVIHGLADSNTNTVTRYASGDFAETTTVTETIPGTANDYTSYTDALKYY